MTTNIRTRRLTRCRVVAVFAVCRELVGGEAPASQQCSTPAITLSSGCTAMHFGENQLSPCSFGISPLPTAPPSLLQQTPVRPFTPCYGRCSLAMGSSHGFRSAPRHQARFSHSLSLCLRLLAALGGDVEQLVGSYSKRHAITPRTDLPVWRSHCMDAVGFRLSFTPLTGVLFTVPSRYCALSVRPSSLPWTVVGPASHGIARVPWYSRWRSPGPPTQVRASHPLWGGVPAASLTCWLGLTVRQHGRPVAQPQRRNGCRLGTALV